MLKMIRKRMNGEKGFTLVELLVVVIIIAILSAIAIPTFLGQRSKAQDSAARSLVRNAATAAESYYSDGATYTGANAAALHAIEPSITFVDQTATICGAAKATTLASSNMVDVWASSATVIELATTSASNKSFGMKIDKAAGTTFYKGAVGGGTW